MIRSRFKTAEERRGAIDKGTAPNAVERVMGALELVLAQARPTDEASLESAAQAVLEALVRCEWRAGAAGHRILGYDDGKPVTLIIGTDGSLSLSRDKLPPPMAKALLQQLLIR